MWLGNLVEDQIIDFKFSTWDADGDPITLAGSPAVSVYKGNGTTESTTGVTLTVDFDARTGSHHVRIDTSDAFYAVANDYQVLITAGTVDGKSVVGVMLAAFSIENRYREADVVAINGDAQSATDLKDFADAGYDPATNKVEGVKLADTTTTVTNDVGITQTGADKVWTSATRTLTAFSTALALSVWDVLESAIATASSIGLKVKTNLDVVLSTRLATSGYTAPPTAAANADAVWDEAIAGHLGAGSTGNALNAAGSAGDPWTTPLPGAYGAGTAGFIVGTNLNATVGSRSSHSAADVWAAATRTITGGTLTTAPPTAAQIATQIIATTLAELPQAVFPATPTVGEALMLPVHMLARGGTFNKTTGVATYRNNAGTVVLKRTDSDDGTTFTEGALVAGP